MAHFVVFHNHIYLETFLSIPQAPHLRMELSPSDVTVLSYIYLGFHDFIRDAGIHLSLKNWKCFHYYPRRLRSSPLIPSNVNRLGKRKSWKAGGVEEIFSGLTTVILDYTQKRNWTNILKKNRYLFCILEMCVHDKSLQLCPTPCNPMDCSPPVYSVHEILQARILEWVAMSSSRRSSRSRDRTCISYISCFGRQVVYH